MADEDMNSSLSNDSLERFRDWMSPLTDDEQKADARAAVLRGSDYFCRERLTHEADGLSAVVERLGQPFQDLMALYQFKGDGSQLLEHCLRVFVGNDLVKGKYTVDAVLFGMRCILEGVFSRRGERFETFDAAYAALAEEVVLSLDRATVAALAAARTSPAAPTGGRTHAGADAGQEPARSTVDGVNMDEEFGGIPKPGGIVWDAMQAKYTPAAFAQPRTCVCPQIQWVYPLAPRQHPRQPHRHHR